MPSYAYRAVQASGRVTSGHMTAVNENELAHVLGESGMELIEAREQSQRSLSFPFAPTVHPRVIAAFCERMHDLLLSGISFPDALRDAEDATENKAVRAALAQISRSIANGNGIAASFALYPRLFQPLFIAMIGAGEKSGDMTAVFEFLSHHTRETAKTQETLRRALRYPLFLLLVAGGAVSFMMAMVIPQVVQFLNGIEGKLPLATRILVGISAAFTDYGPALVAAAAATALIIAVGRKVYSPFAILYDAFLLRLPFIGAIITKTSLARFAHSFSLLFRNGCDVPACLHQAQATVGNLALRADMAHAALRVQSGVALSLALAPVMPAFAVGLLRTGERSGNLGKCLNDIAMTYDREAKAAADTFIGMLEPLLTLAVGGVMAWTVAAMLGPLYGGLSVLGERM